MSFLESRKFKIAFNLSLSLINNNKYRKKIAIL